MGDPSLSTIGISSFTPRPMFGSRHPKHSGKICYGVDLRDLPARDTSFYLKGELNLCYLVEAYNNYPYKRKFFLKGGFFNRLAGSDKLKKRIEAGLSIDEIEKVGRMDLGSLEEDLGRAERLFLTSYSPKVFTLLLRIGGPFLPLGFL